MSEATLIKVTRKGQVTIPQTLREEMDIQAGDYVTFHPLMGGILLSKATVTPQVEAKDVLRDLVIKIGKEAEQRGIHEEEDLDPIIEDIQSRVYREYYGP
jgi:AbrB family looped-hinge helix DNA binding protein